MGRHGAGALFPGLAVGISAHQHIERFGIDGATLLLIGSAIASAQCSCGARGSRDRLKRSWRGGVTAGRVAIATGRLQRLRKPQVDRAQLEQGFRRKLAVGFTKIAEQ